LRRHFEARCDKESLFLLAFDAEEFLAALAIAGSEAFFNKLLVRDKLRPPIVGPRRLAHDASFLGRSASAEYVPRLLDDERGHHRLVDRGSRQISLLLTVRECVVATECKSAYMSSLGCRRRRTRPGCRTVGGRNSDHTTTPNRPCPIRLSPLTSRFSAT
jgi:hypothetical protein